jgi:hypothetical protein
MIHRADSFLKRTLVARTRITLKPRGPLSADSEGVIFLTNGLRSTFRMEEINPPSNWRWGGSFLWLAVHYDHRFERMSENDSKITFIIDVEGFGAAFFGRIFAAIYAVNLDRAIPRLVEQLESGQALPARLAISSKVRPRPGADEQ